MLFKNAKLEVLTEEDQHFIYPSLDEACDLPPSAESIVRGRIRLTLAKPKALSRLLVRLDTTFTLRHPQLNDEQNGKLYFRTYTLDLENKVHQAGVHEFGYSFVLPGTLPATERQGANANIETVVSAELTLARQRRRVLRASKMLYCVVSPGGKDEMPPGVEILVEEVSRNLGPYRIDIASEALTVGGLLNIRLSFPAPTNHCQINQLYCQIVTRSAYLGRCSRTVEEYTDVFRIKDSLMPLSSKSISLPCLRPEVASSFAVTERIPNEGQLQPTTHPGTRSVIHISHELLLTVIYSVSGKKGQQAITVRKQIGLASCRCLSEALLLPRYSASDQKFSMNRQCACQVPTAQLVRESPLARDWMNRGLEAESCCVMKK